MADRICVELTKCGKVELFPRLLFLFYETYIPTEFDYECCLSRLLLSHTSFVLGELLPSHKRLPSCCSLVNHLWGKGDNDATPKPHPDSTKNGNLVKRACQIEI